MSILPEYMKIYGAGVRVVTADGVADAWGEKSWWLLVVGYRVGFAVLIDIDAG